MSTAMSGSSNPDIAVPPAEPWASGSDAASQAAVPRNRVRSVWVRCGIQAALVLAYRAALEPLLGAFGAPAFLLGLGLCLSAAATLGIRGALVVIGCVAFIDRDVALGLPSAPDTGRVAGIIALLVKLVLAGGLGLVVDSRRRARELNIELRRQIEARKQSEESLKHGESMRSALVESLGEGVGLFDASDHLVFVNQALAATLDVSPSELETKTFADFLTEESRQTVRTSKPKLGERRSYEVVLENSPSSLLLVTETRFEPSGSQRQLTLRVVRDLTERVVTERRQRDLERELQRSQALQSLAVMAGGVAHDFNNLLCGVVGNVEVARLKVPPNAPAALSRCLEEIGAFAGEAAQLSKQMLAYAGRRSLAIEALELNEELQAALRLLHATVESRAQLVLELGDALPQVAADRGQLRQVVTNLVLNALDAMEGKRGTLTLRSEAVELRAPSGEELGLAAGAYLKVTISDTGSGIVDEARERLFEPFFSTKGAGRGMGLAAAAGIVRAHRGRLAVERTSSLGTSFGVLLPVAQDSLQLRSATPTAALGVVASRNVLLIDDEAAVRLVTGRMLSELGHRVITAESGQRGLELIEEHRGELDLVILDLTMPELSGEQTLDRLRSLQSDIPVVISSGFQADDAASLLGRPHVVGFLEKPHTMTNLEMSLASVAVPRKPGQARKGAAAAFAKVPA